MHLRKRRIMTAFLRVIGGQVISIYFSEPSGAAPVRVRYSHSWYCLSCIDCWFDRWTPTPRPTGVAFQSLQLKDYCAGEWGRHKACCQEHAPHTHTHTILSLPHGALVAKVRAFSRQNKGVWKGLGNYRGMCISVYTVELTWRQLWRAQFRSTTGRPCVCRPLLMAHKSKIGLLRLNSHISPRCAHESRLWDGDAVFVGLELFHSSCEVLEGTLGDLCQIHIVGIC